MLTHVTLAPRNDRANGDDDNRAIENEALSSPALPCHASLLSTSMDGYQPATRTVLAPDLLCAACVSSSASRVGRRACVHGTARHGMTTLLASYYALVIRPDRSCLRMRQAGQGDMLAGIVQQMKQR